MPGKNEILTPASARWYHFVDGLYGAMRVSNGERRCDGDSGPHTYRYTIQVLTGMGDVNVPATLDYFRDCLASCDCQILAILAGEAGNIALHTGPQTIRRVNVPLFCVTSYADLGRYRNVRMEWVVSQRPAPLFGPAGSSGFAYHHLIHYYDDDMMYDAKDRKDSEMCVDELFTADEAKAFVKFMRTRRKVQASIERFEIPILQVYGLASSDGTKVDSDCLSFSDDPDYDLPFRTMGYSDRRWPVLVV
jgi:hypothetical protein